MERHRREKRNVAHITKIWSNCIFHLSIFFPLSLIMQQVPIQRGQITRGGKDGGRPRRGGSWRLVGSQSLEDSTERWNARTMQFWTRASSCDAAARPRWPYTFRYQRNRPVVSRHTYKTSAVDRAAGTSNGQTDIPAVNWREPLLRDAYKHIYFFQRLIFYPVL